MKRFEIKKAKQVREIPAGHYAPISAQMAWAIWVDLMISGPLPRLGHFRPFCMFQDWSTEIHNKGNGRYEILRHR